jgi:hypothetical protein
MKMNFFPYLKCVRKCYVDLSLRFSEMTKESLRNMLILINKIKHVLKDLLFLSDCTDLYACVWKKKCFRIQVNIIYIIKGFIAMVDLFFGCCRRSFNCIGYIFVSRSATKNLALNCRMIDTDTLNKLVYCKQMHVKTSRELINVCVHLPIESVNNSIIFLIIY